MHLLGRNQNILPNIVPTDEDMGKYTQFSSWFGAVLPGLRPRVRLGLSLTSRVNLRLSLTLRVYPKAFPNIVLMVSLRLSLTVRVQLHAFPNTEGLASGFP